MDKLRVLLPLICLLASWTDASTPCPQQWTSAGEWCYKYVQEKKTWDGAKAHCTKLSSYLAEPSTTAILNDLKSAIGNVAQNMWIGLKKGELGDWIWAHSDEEVNYYLLPPLVNAPGQDCMTINVQSTSLTWNTDACSLGHTYVCQKSSTEK